MARTHNSWEIILAGLFLTALAIYMVSGNGSSDGNSSEPASPSQPKANATVPSQETKNQRPTATLNLDQLEEQLKRLENNEELKERGQLKNLQELQQLQHLGQWQKQQGPGEFEIKVEGKDKESIEAALEKAARKLEQLPIDLPIDLSDIQIRQTDDNTYAINPTPAVKASSAAGDGHSLIKQLDAKGVEQINLKLASSHINIKGHEGTEIVVRARSSKDKLSAEELRDQVTLELNRDGNEANLDMDLADKGWFTFFNTDHYTVTIELPRTINTEGNTSGGHITLSNLDGTHDLATSGGHIEASDLSGTYKLATSGGHISVANAGAELELSTSGGHIELNEADGRMQVETSGGSITGTRLMGSLSAETSGGSIKADFREVRGDILLETSAGNISLALPPATAADVELEGSGVDIGSGFGFSGVKETGEARGSINGGGSIRISCRTLAGNVTLTGNNTIQ